MTSRRDNRRRLRAVLVAGAMFTALLVATVPAGAQGSDGAASNDYLIVTLTGSPAAHDDSTFTHGRFDSTSQGFARALDRMQRQHARFADRLASVAPGAEIVDDFFVTANAVVVKRNGASASAIRSISGVLRTADSTLYKPDMNLSLGLIGADTYWATFGGSRASAGSGVKVAVIDSGIDPNHPFFSCKDVNFGGVYFSGQGILPGVASASAIFGPGYTPGPGDPLYFSSEHGTHVAGTIGGCITTITLPSSDLSDVWNETELSGVAPGAELWDYNVFPFIGAGMVAFGGSAFSHDIAEAIEDAVLDGMDVINMSLGGGVQGPHDFLGEVSNAAVAAGVVVVASNGNEGDDPYTVGSPGSASEVIGVGATTNAHRLIAQVTTPGGVYEAAVGEFDDFDGLSHTFIDWPGTDNQACTSGVADASLAGEIVLISRGTCSFSQKMDNAKAAGAYGVIVYNNQAGDPIPMARTAGFDDFIPAVMVSQGDGATLEDEVPTTATVTPRIVVPATPNLLTDFSSRGPAPFTHIVKPDVVAPGENILSSVIRFTPFGVTGHSWELFSGTSMSAPHVAGTAALLLESSGWTPAQVKSALVTTATDLGYTVWEQGGGLINVPAAADASVFFYPSNASFGVFKGNAPANGSIDIEIDGGSCSANASGSFVSASVSGATLTVEFNGARTAPSAMYDGYVEVDCGVDGTYHLPWLAVVDR